CCPGMVGQRETWVGLTDDFGPLQNSVDHEQEDRAADGEQSAAQVEAGNIPEAEEVTADVAADKRAGDAEQDGDDEPAWAYPRHQQLRKEARHKSQHDPGKDSHNIPSDWRRSRSPPM